MTQTGICTICVRKTELGDFCGDLFLGVLQVVSGVILLSLGSKKSSEVLPASGQTAILRSAIGC